MDVGGGGGEEGGRDVQKMKYPRLVLIRQVSNNQCTCFDPKEVKPT